MVEVFSEISSSVKSIHFEEVAGRIKEEISSKLPEMPHLPEKLSEFHAASKQFWDSIDWSRLSQRLDDSLLSVFPFLDNGNHTLSIAPVLNQILQMHSNYAGHQVMFAIFFGGAMSCLFASFVFHTFMGVSSKWCFVLARCTANTNFLE